MPNIRSAYTDKCIFYGKTTPSELVAKYGSPLYVYNEQILRQRCKDMVNLCKIPGFFVNYSTKANTNLELLRIIHSEGCLADSMSPGEMRLNLMAGTPKEDLLYACNNVSPAEMQEVIAAGVLISADSLSQLEQYGRLNPKGSIMLRINPGKGAGHHKSVITAGKDTKFGIEPEHMDDAKAIIEKYQLKLVGLNQHIGSLFMEAEKFLESVDFLIHFMESRTDGLFKDVNILDFGGGFGIPYHKYEHEASLDLVALGNGLTERIAAFKARTGYNGRFLVEPGRYISAECGILLGTVYALKTNTTTRYVGTDIGFNVLVRPVMYESHHDLEIYRKNGLPDNKLMPQTVVGNICESGDVLAKNRNLPQILEGDIIGALDAGAYGYVMASSYNQRGRPAEVLITLEGLPKLIRRRESFEDMLSLYVD